MTKLALKILQYKNSGKSIREIAKLVGCSKSSVSYHLIGEPAKKLALLNSKKYKHGWHPYIKHIKSFIRTTALRKNRFISSNKQTKLILINKIQSFHNPKRKGKGITVYNKPIFTLEDIINKFGNNPICYLTGQPIDINKPTTFSFDHIIPASRGGTSTLDNLGICTRKANMSKTDMTPDEYINLCKLVLEHNGYIVSKN